MKLRLLLLICLSWLWHWTHPGFVQLWVGHCQPDDVRFLQAHGARVVPTRHGLSIQAEAAGLVALADWEGCLRTQRDLIQENLANARTLMTCEGTPYRRKWLAIDESGQAVVRQDSSDFVWVYDPTHPAAVREGSHRGYVANPNVNCVAELAALQVVNERLERVTKAS